MNGMNAVMNGMSNMPMNMNMPALNMSLFQQQMLHDALALSTPVAGADDERLIIDTLVDARARKDNYKNALNSLHGVSPFSPTVKDLTSYRGHRKTVTRRRFGKIST